MHLGKKIAFGILALALGAAPVAALAADPTGIWQADDGKSRYKITNCSADALCARLIWLRDKDDKNIQYLNQVIVQGRQSAENKWTGTVKQGGDTYAGTMVLTGEDSLKVNGCRGVFCQTVRLSRV
ncbi:MAG: DUF2147 domain-containing protein [Alphaproteobacteria bacterium]|nr:MAG: DUF2147 domain-containing protein [Alphaproteobacteria bacterium]